MRRLFSGAAADLAAALVGANELNKENEAPVWHPGLALADVPLEVPQELLLAPDCGAGSAASKNVRFSSPLLTPKSDALAAANGRSVATAIREDAFSQMEHGSQRTCFADLPETWRNKIALYEQRIEDLNLEVRFCCCRHVMWTTQGRKMMPHPQRHACSECRACPALCAKKLGPQAVNDDDVFYLF